jgi:hypothetical protein
MDKARAYTVTTPNAEFHSKATMFLDQSLPGRESVSYFWTGLIHALNKNFSNNNRKYHWRTLPQKEIIH